MKSIKLIVIVVIVIAKVFIAQICKNVPVSASQIDMCNAGVCDVETHTMLELDLGENPDNACFNIKMGADVINKITISAGRMSHQIPFKRWYTSADYQTSVVSVECNCPVTIDGTGAYPWGVSCDGYPNCILLQGLQFKRPAETNIFNMNGGCLLTGDVNVGIATSFKFVPKYDIFELGEWDTDVTFTEKEVVNNVTTIKYAHWNPNDLHLYLNGQNIKITSVISKTIKLKDLTNMVLVIDRNRPFLSYLANKEDVNIPGNFDIKKLGFIQLGSDGVARYDSNVLKQHLAITVQHCGHGIITSSLMAPTKIQMTPVQNYLGSPVNIFVDGNDYANFINQNLQNYDEDTNNILSSSQFSDLKYNSYIDASTGTPLLLNVNTTINMNTGCYFTIKQDGIVKHSSTLSVFDCKTSDCGGQLDEAVYTIDANCNLIEEIAHQSIGQIKTFASRYISYSNYGNFTNNCFNLYFNATTAGVIKITTDTSNYNLIETGGRMTLHTSPGTPILLDVTSTQTLTFENSGSVSPNVTNCYQDQVENVLIMQVKNNDPYTSNVYVTSNVSGLIYSGFYPITQYFTKISIPIVRHWQDENVKFSICHNDKCDYCKTFVTNIEPIDIGVVSGYQTKLISQIKDSFVGAAISNLASTSWTYYIIIIAIALFVIIIGFGIVVLIITWILSYVYGFFKIIKIIFSPFSMIFSALSNLKNKVRSKTKRRKNKRKKD
jgi:hypothetical protein